MKSREIHINTNHLGSWISMWYVLDSTVFCFLLKDLIIALLTKMKILLECECDRPITIFLVWSASTKTLTCTGLCQGPVLIHKRILVAFG